MRRLLTLVVLLTALVAPAACSTSQQPALTVSPGSALYDDPVTVSVAHLDPGSETEVRLTSKDRSGTLWSSRARYRIGRSGSLTLAQAPTSGSYTGAAPMGLFDALAPGGNPAHEAVFDPPDDWRMTVSVTASGAATTSRTIRRLLPLQVGVTAHRLTLVHDGVVGELYLPPKQSDRRPAVLVFGGSEGGLSMELPAAALAANGYPALALAYFREPGLPQSLHRIPLEYFTHAVQDLDRQSQVDPRHVVVWGLSRGSEAAQLLGADDPNLVDGVVATVPSAVAGPAVGDVTEPAWTVHGRPVPFNPDNLSGESNPGTTPPANIAVERIRGPVLLVCGTKDQVWPSCPWTDAIIARLRAHTGAPVPTVLRADGAGHLVGVLLAGLPDTETSASAGAGVRTLTGGTPLADAQGERAGWNDLLHLLDSLRSNP